ncbi:hypothetical protein HJFPF1_05546 [Paramyrothecium foliicola]|nr:hypothetical protein HJFPF1_05546 [Paramyrothecium foliicola]
MFGYILDSAVVAMLLVSGSAAQLNPSCAPGGNFDLSKWRLQMPIGSPGSPQTISSANLQGCNGYTSSSYFFTGGDGALVMKVPGSPSTSQCVTTPNSKHCRTEFRENSPSKWSPFGAVNRLFGDLKVVKNDDEICVGQIHIDDSISHKPVAELYYASNGRLSMGVQKCRTCTQQRSEIDNVPKGQRFTYEIRYEKNVLSVSINGKAFKTLDTFELNGPDSYFKAGNYNQGDGQTEVHFYNIRVSHTEGDSGNPEVPEQPENPPPTGNPGTCAGVPSVASVSTLTLRLFEENTCCKAVQTTKLGNLDTCHNSAAPFKGFYEAVGQGMFGRNIRVYTFTGKDCAGTSANFKLTNDAQCWNSGATWQSFRISAN